MEFLSWEEAIIELRKAPEHFNLIYNSYLSDNLLENCYRFSSSLEFTKVLEIIRTECPNAIKILDLASGNGIASYAFAKSGFEVTSLEPDPSKTVGLGAIDFIKHEEKLNNLTIVAGFGEEMPFNDEEFEVVYLRQALHHSKDLYRMVGEIHRVLKKDGLFLATREHVVDNYKECLQEFLNSQPDHLLYGGENAFTLKDYKKAIRSKQFNLIKVMGPFDSEINLNPNNMANIHFSITHSKKGKLLSFFLGEKITIKLGLLFLRNTKIQGRIYSFIAKKSKVGNLNINILDNQKPI
jgi:ubiquinone/menaquinone biosynthesis C-methylase UbiE